MSRKIKMKEYIQGLLKTKESTSSTDHLLTKSTTSGLTNGHHQASVLLHSLPPRTHRPSRNPYQPTTVPKTSSRTHFGKYDKVPTSDSLSSGYLSYDNELKSSWSMMEDDQQTQVQQNLQQEFCRQPSFIGKDVDKCSPSIQEENQWKPRRWGPVLPQVIAALSLSLGSLIVGFVSGYTSPATESMEKDAENGDIYVDKTIISWIGGIMPLAALVGGVMGGPLIDCLGRKRTILATAIPFMISSLLIALAPNVILILVGRAIAGFCVGVTSLALPVYLGETIQPQVRGTLGLLPTAFGNTGFLICFIAGKYLTWRHLAYLGTALPIPFLILTVLIPETPRWYATRGDIDNAEKSLKWLRGNTDITEEVEQVKKVMSENEKEGNDSALRSLLAPACVKPLLILIGLMFFQQMSGINAVMFYTVTIFKDAGTNIDHHFASIIVAVVNFLSTFIATALIDKMGRKMLLYISGSSMVATLGTLGAFFYLQMSGQDLQAFGWVPLCSFVVYVVGFSLGFGPIPWLMMGEILPAKVRGPAASIATAFNWSCTFFVTKTFGDIIQLLGKHGAFWIFGGFCFVGVIFTYALVPETRGKTLEDIEKTFSRRMSSVANLRPTPLAV